MTILLVPNLKIYHFLHQTSTFQHQDCKYNNCCLKHPNIAFLVPSGRILILQETFELDKLKDVDYKYDKRFLTFQPKDRNRAFLIQHLFFSFWMKLYSSQIRGWWLKVWCWNKNFGPKFIAFLFLDETLQVIKFKNVDFKYGISFLKFQPKIPI